MAPPLTGELTAANAVTLARVGRAFPDHVTATIVDHLLAGASQDTVDAGQDVGLQVDRVGWGGHGLTPREEGWLIDSAVRQHRRHP